MTTARGIAPSPSRLPRKQRANWPTAPAVVGKPANWLRNAAVWEERRSEMTVADLLAHKHEQDAREMSNVTEDLS